MYTTVASSPEATAAVESVFQGQLLDTLKALSGSETGRLVIQTLEFWVKAQVFQFVNQGFWGAGASGAFPKILRNWFKPESATLKVNSTDPIYGVSVPNPNHAFSTFEPDVSILVGSLGHSMDGWPS